MGFFQELKEDLSQAVNEMMPEEENLKQKSEESGEFAEVEAGLQEGLDRILEQSLRKEFENVPETENVSEIKNVPKKESFSDAQASQETNNVWKSESDYAEEDGKNPETLIEKKTDYEKENGNSQEDIKLQNSEIVSGDEKVVETPDDSSDYEEREAFTPDSVVGHINVADTQEGQNTIQKEKEVKKTVEDSRFSLKDETPVDETAVITEGMVISGDIISKGNMNLLGEIEGNIEILGKLNISGKVSGDSSAEEIYAESARISGNLKAKGTIKVGADSVIIGNLDASSAIIAGAVKGDLDIKGPVVLDASAVIMGNIKSKSIQINSGAVIEGMCSQCYAEQRPTSFFDERFQS